MVLQSVASGLRGVMNRTAASLGRETNLDYTTGSRDSKTLYLAADSST